MNLGQPAFVAAPLTPDHALATQWLSQFGAALAQLDKPGITALFDHTKRRRRQYCKLDLDQASQRQGARL